MLLGMQRMDLTSKIIIKILKIFTTFLVIIMMMLVPAELLNYLLCLFNEICRTIC